MRIQNIAITGASSGIGAAIAQEYAAPDVKLYLSARDEGRLQSVSNKCKALGADVEYHVLDITEMRSVEEWFCKIDNKNQIDLIFSCAGIMRTSDEDNPIEPIDRTMEQISTNLCGSIYAANAAGNCMKERRHGKIVLIGSMAALQPISDVQGYSASKAGLVAYGEALYAALAPFGVKVHTICPGYVATAMNSSIDSFRPFEISAEQTAKRIKRALGRGWIFYSFPFSLLTLIKFGRLLPIWLRKHTNKPFNFVTKK